MAGKAKLVADIGTDHAYLPIHMLLGGKADRAIATDVNKGPLERARKNAERYGVSDKIELLLTDGLNGVERYSPDVAVIAGMGGELSARIISAAPFLKEGKCRLILQPMTKINMLRFYLTVYGFSITDERLVRDGKLYVVISAVYTGRIENYSQAELIVGKADIHGEDPLFEEYVTETVMKLQKKLDGMLASPNRDKYEIGIAHLAETIKELRDIIGHG